jgi:hypothetical protein
VTADEMLMDLCVRLCSGDGPIMDGRLSVGPWTPAVADGFTWAVLDRRGAPLWLGHDAFEAARAYLRFQDMDADDLALYVEDPTHARTDAQAAADGLYERWAYDYRHWGLPLPRSLEAFGYSEEQS